MGRDICMSSQPTLGSTQLDIKSALGDVALPFKRPHTGITQELSSRSLSRRFCTVFLSRSYLGPSRRRLSRPRTGLKVFAARSHRVADGETLYSIAKMYGIHIEKLRSTNRLSTEHKIEIDQKLRLPKGATLVESELLPSPSNGQTLQSYTTTTGAPSPSSPGIAAGIGWGSLALGVLMLGALLLRAFNLWRAPKKYTEYTTVETQRGPGGRLQVGETSGRERLRALMVSGPSGEGEAPSRSAKYEPSKKEGGSQDDSDEPPLRELSWI
ncbi:hypothetical protein CYMTET_5695 [Cymbomonas tetramitiformis]|uniref:LysM domain-containing protein n=1 Tax=Cymbomonas tetramitiformis TaxID=36881 RepID=A0AAE0GYK5_9CHLO|nr:hypothetical protein CYMTET_5695 [Cymbomonas tetramitiformis]